MHVQFLSEKLDAPAVDGFADCREREAVTIAVGFSVGAKIEKLETHWIFLSVFR